MEPRQQLVQMQTRGVILVQMNRAMLPFDILKDSSILVEDKSKRDHTLDIQFIVGGSIRPFSWYAENDAKTQSVWDRWREILGTAHLFGSHVRMVNLDEMEAAESVLSPAETPENDNLKEIVAAMLPGLQRAWEGRPLTLQSAKTIGVYGGYIQHPQTIKAVACVRARLGVFAEAHGLPTDSTLTVKQYRECGAAEFGVDQGPEVVYHYRITIEHDGKRVFISEKTLLRNGFDQVIEGVRTMTRYNTYKVEAAKILGILQDVACVSERH